MFLFRYFESSLDVHDLGDGEADIDLGLVLLLQAAGGHLQLPGRRHEGLLVAAVQGDPSVLYCTVLYYFVLYLVQWASSDLSSQSLMLLHLWIMGMQTPLEQLNSSPAAA